MGFFTGKGVGGGGSVPYATNKYELLARQWVKHDGTKGKVEHEK